mgnify:CR=1 FL=1
MEWVNYHHLLYFWVVAKEGGLVKAGKALRLSHPTLSTQIRALEDALGEKLFTKVGRKLSLTESGRVAFRYADQIFTLGQEMVDTLKGRSSGQALRLNVGIVDVIPKLVVRGLLEPALEFEEPVRLVCSEGSFDRLLADLALHSLHVVISDAPVPPGSKVRAYNHLIGESGVSLFGTSSLHDEYIDDFPKSLDGAPMLLPLESLTLRRSIDQWLEANDLRPQIVGEFADSALLKVFGADGAGLFPAPTAVADEVCRQDRHGKMEKRKKTDSCRNRKDCCCSTFTDSS